MKPVYKKCYYLNYTGHVIKDPHTNIPRFNYSPGIDNTFEYINNIVVYESNKVDEIYNTNKKICINDEILTINEVVKVVDKDEYIYIVEECEYINDEESKKKAELDYENYLKIKKQEKEEERKIKESTMKKIIKLTDEQKKQLTFKNKKWWQFWK